MSLASVGTIERRSMVAPFAERKTRPVILWAALGAFFVALQIYVFSDWILSGKAVRTPPGPTPVPTFMKICAVAWGIVGVPATALVVYHFLIKQWRRAGHLTLDGMFVIASILMYWQDPLSNYFQWSFTYNAYYPNWGSWVESVPGWMSPNGHRLAEPPFIMGPIYIYMVFGMMVVGCAVMRKAKSRWPQLGAGGLIAVCVAFFIVFDAILEPLFLTTGFYIYVHAIEGWTLFEGRYFQFPIYEPIFWGVCWAALTCLRYFKDDKGHTIVERGVDRVGVSARAKTAVRLLAVVGCTNLIFLVGYNIPYSWFALHTSSWPKDITDRSYLTNGICGPGTTYACPGPDVPINRPGAIHISPDGTLVVPPGAKVPSP
ncbi:MAG TPA: spirocyclase AveC family protein [Acidimicrobiia bacterium]|nr:spirocyclase AveC family protein [Acidimicrobiia bacterium]